MIEVTINGESRQTACGLTVETLLRSLEIDGGRVAVELNRQIVPQTAWHSTCIETGAEIEIVHFVGGG